MAALAALLRLSAETDHRTPWLVDVLRTLSRKTHILLHPYRPERHYMRGPGPRWHAKHGAAPLVSSRS